MQSQGPQKERGCTPGTGKHSLHKDSFHGGPGMEGQELSDYNFK